MRDHLDSSALTAHSLSQTENISKSQLSNIFEKNERLGLLALKSLVR